MAPVASSQARLTGSCCWQRPPPLNPAHLSTELFRVLTQWPLAFKGVSEPRGRGESYRGFHGQASEATCFWSIPLVPQESPAAGREGASPGTTSGR